MGNGQVRAMVGCGLLSVFVLLGRAAPPAPPGEGSPAKDMQHRDFGDDCARAGCHGGLMEARRLHGPVAQQDCGVCHEPVGDSPDHRFQPTRPPDKLCAYCHRAVPPRGSAQLHRPYAESQCTECHDPHGGMTVQLLKADRPAELCWECHDEFGGKLPHRPVEEGNCLACHDPHESKYDNLMRRPDEELCLRCHRELAKSRKAAAHVHEPGPHACTACHLGHGGDDKAFLRPHLDALCLDCHRPVAAALADPVSVHSATGQQRGCLKCHLPHASAVAALLVSQEPDLCYGCHDREIALPDQRIIADVKGQITAARHLHAPVEQGRCDDCHAPHGSPYARLLVAGYPVTEYAPYDESTYALCFKCHDVRLVSEVSSTRTGFRDGDRNLHRVHVEGEEGRTCTLCHEIHGGDLPKLMRRSIPFGPGGWTLQINFEQTATGGSCACGCHRKRGYDNTTPSPVAGTSAARPATMFVRAPRGL